VPAARSGGAIGSSLAHRSRLDACIIALAGCQLCLQALAGATRCCCCQAQLLIVAPQPLGTSAVGHARQVQVMGAPQTPCKA
jgi:hypothetical protein